MYPLVCKKNRSQGQEGHGGRQKRPKQCQKITNWIYKLDETLKKATKVNRLGWRDPEPGYSKDRGGQNGTSRGTPRRWRSVRHDIMDKNQNGKTF